MALQIIVFVVVFSPHLPKVDCISAMISSSSSSSFSFIISISSSFTGVRYFMPRHSNLYKRGEGPSYGPRRRFSVSLKNHSFVILSATILLELPMGTNSVFRPST